MHQHLHSSSPDFHSPLGQRIVWLITGLGLVGLIIYGWRFGAQHSALNAGDFGPTTYQYAKITEAVVQPLSEDVISPDLLPPTGTEQKLKVELLKTHAVVDIGIEESSASDQMKVGDKVIVSATPRVDGGTTYGLIDKDRLPSLTLILIVFVVLLLIFAGFSGVTSLMGLVFSMAVLGGFVVPQILEGRNPLLISVIGAFAIALISLYLAHGFKRRISVALLGTVITILIAIALAYIFVHLAGLTGNGTEEAFNLNTTGSSSGLNLQGLLLGGIIIGTLGVLGDITTAQAAVVEELHHANPTLSIAELYRRGSSVGREHIIALVNTLALAYVGAALPLLLIFITSAQPFLVVINGQLVAEEIVRTLVGSSALILAVPITTYLAAQVFGRMRQLP